MNGYIECRLLILADDLDLNEVQDFKNNVFEMHAYAFDVECDCGRDTELENNHPHKDTCAILAPNFKCGDISITWYKHIGRSMTINRKVTREELRQMFRKCETSLD